MLPAINLNDNLCFRTIKISNVIVYNLLPVKLQPFNCLPLSFDHSKVSASVMFLLRFLDICFRLLLYASMTQPFGSFQIPPHPPFLKEGTTNKYNVSDGFYPLTSTKTHNILSEFWFRPQEILSARLVNCIIRVASGLVRTEKGLVGLCLFVFLLCLVFSMFAHAATGLAAALTEAAVRTGVFLEEDYFSHFL